MNGRQEGRRSIGLPNVIKPTAPARLPSPGIIGIPRSSQGETTTTRARTNAVTQSVKITPPARRIQLVRRELDWTISLDNRSWLCV